MDLVARLNDIGYNGWAGYAPEWSQPEKTRDTATIDKKVSVWKKVTKAVATGLVGMVLWAGPVSDYVSSVGFDPGVLEAEAAPRVKYNERKIKSLRKRWKREAKTGTISQGLIDEVVNCNMEIYNTYRKSLGLSQVRNNPELRKSMKNHLENVQGRYKTPEEWLAAGSKVHYTIVEDEEETVHPSVLQIGSVGITESMDPFYAIFKLLADFGHRQRLLKGVMNTDKVEDVGMDLVFNGKYWDLGVMHEALEDEIKNEDYSVNIAPQSVDIGIAYMGGDSIKKVNGGYGRYSMPITIFFNDLDGSQISDVSIKLYEKKGNRKREVPLFYSWNPLTEEEVQAGKLGFLPNKTVDGELVEGWQFDNGYGAIAEIGKIKHNKDYIIEVEYTIKKEGKEAERIKIKDIDFETAKAPKKY